MVTGTLSFVDAATPGSIQDGPYDGTCYYLGGDTPHVWTKAELDARPERYRLGIFVRSNPIGTTQAINDVHTCLAQLVLMGQPKGTLVCLDMETAQDPTYVIAFCTSMLEADYPVIVYGSQSDVFGNHNPEGLYFGAEWTGTPHLASGDAMTQYVSFTGYDIDQAKPSLPFWDTKTVAPVPPQPVREESSVIVLTDLYAHGAAICLPVPAGKTKVLFYADQGYLGMTPPELRLGFASVKTFIAATVKPTWNSPVTADVPEGATRFTLARLDTGAVPITVDFA
jgi:hypothetical protein